MRRWPHFVIFNYFAPKKKEVRFRALAGALRVTRDGDLLSLDFPSRPPQPIDLPAIVDAMGVTPSEMWKARDHLAR